MSKTDPKLGAVEQYRLPGGLLGAETALLNAFFYNLNDGVAVADQFGKLFYLNPAGARLTGRMASQNLPEKWTDEYGLFKPDEKTRFPTEELPLVRALRGESVTQIQLFIRNEDLPEGLHVSTNASPLWGADGKITGAIALFRDITVLVRAREQLQTHATELTRSNQELEKFAYIASHDLKEPLRMVSNYVRLLQRRYEERFDQTGKEFMGYALEGAERMYGMIDSLLEYSRLAYQSRETVVVSLQEILQTVLKNLEAAIQESGARVEYGVLPETIGNPHRLMQLFQNLLSNAVKFKGSEPPHIQVSCSSVGDSWLCQVKDNGIGIDPMFHQRVFDIFQRVHPRSEYPGNGIGLSICKKIVESYGGKMWVESEVGQGSTFYFTLPRANGPSSSQLGD